MKKLLVMLLIMVGMVACSQNSSNEVVNADNASQQPAASADNATAEPAPAKVIDIPADVQAMYKGLIVSIVDKKSNKETDTEVLIGQKVDVAGTPVSVEIEAYLPDFVMDEAGKITSKSTEEGNPAAKVKIYKAGAMVFEGWLFKNFPDIHPFEDADYGVSLKNSVKN